MTVNFNSNVGYAPLKSNSNVNFAKRNENMEAPKKSNTKKYVAAGVGLAALAAAVVFRKPLGNAVKSLMGKIKLPEVKMPKIKKPDVSAISEAVTKGVKDAFGKVSEKFGTTANALKIGNIGEKFGNIWNGAKDYAVKGWKMAQKYGKAVVDWAMNLFNKLFHKPVEVPTNIAGLLK